MNAVTDSPNPSPSTLSIVVGLAFTDSDGPAFDQATRIAQRVPRSALHLVHVFHADLSEERSRDLIGHLRLYVNEKAAAAKGLRGMTVGIHLRAGQVVREIVQLAAEVQADLIVVGSQKGPHLKQWIMGSTAEKLVAGGPCSVLVASPRPTQPEKHEPAIEAPCSDCLRTRASSSGSHWWCERHSQHAKRAHVYSYQRELPLASHDSEVIPTGIDF